MALIRLFLISLLAWMAVSCSHVHKPLVIQMDIYRAKNDGDVEDVPKGHPLRASLDRLTGYEHYVRLESTSTLVTNEYSDLRVPKSGFSVRLMRVDAYMRDIEIELFHKDKKIFEGRFKPKPNVPLFITGPRCHKGSRIVLVLTVQP
jgi:hypothetical protein